MFFQMGSGERTKLGGSRGVHQGGAIGQGLLCLPLLPVHMSIREKHESRGVEAYACFNDTTIAAHEMTPETVELVPYIER